MGGGLGSCIESPAQICKAWDGWSRALLPSYAWLWKVIQEHCRLTLFHPSRLTSRVTGENSLPGNHSLFFKSLASFTFSVGAQCPYSALSLHSCLLQHYCCAPLQDARLKVLHSEVRFRRGVGQGLASARLHVNLQLLSLFAGSVSALINKYPSCCFI